LAPLQHRLDQFHLEALHILLLHDRQLTLHRHLCNAACRVLQHPQGRRHFLTQARGVLALLAKYKAREQRRTLLGREVVKGAVEHEFREQQLVARADLARDAPLLLDNVVGGGKAEAAQYTFATLELVELQHIVRCGDLRLDRGHPVLRRLLRGIERIQFVAAPAVLGDRCIRNALAQNLLLAEQLLKLDIVDLHILDRVEQREALREAAVHLGHVLADLCARLLEAQVLGQEQADPA